MDVSFMGTTHRHNKLAYSINASLFNLIKLNKVTVLLENVALVHWGRKGRGELISLVDVAVMDSSELDEFKLGVINDLETIQPDVCVFYKNKYVKNTRDTRFAGVPDLVVEIWSESNTKEEKYVKKSLYQGSNTEHWYIEQNSNDVECWIGSQQVNSQSLNNILVDTNGLRYDLRHLVL